jgi:3-oxoacyl-[acyl-carrier-protein] synthase-1
MHRRVFVTGIGIITSIGNGIEENLDSIRKLKSGIGSLSLFNSKHKGIPVAEVKMSNIELAAKAGIDIENGIFSRNTLLALNAVKQVMNTQHQPKKGRLRPGLIMATTVGGMDLNEKYYKSLLQEDTFKEYIPAFDSADFTERIARFFGITHHITTISTACSSSANAIMFATRLIQSRRIDSVIVGGSDALTKFTLNGFCALEILSPTGCMPFDQNRNGLTIGEGAAVLLLESEDTVDSKNIICEIKGFANVNEAFHQTASSADGYGASMAMQKALSFSGIQPTDIQYINAHGTGTEINDLSEGRAIEKVFSTDIPPVSSTKAFTGHTLGAAGAVEAAYAALAIREQLLLPSLKCIQPMRELRFRPQTTVASAEIKNVLSNSFGFGGNNTSLVFSKV